MTHFKINFVGCLLLFFVCSHVISQDQAVIHIDKPFYVAGEVVLYKAYLPSSFFDVSGKVKVVVESGDKSYRHESFIQLADGELSGYFKVPFNISSDVYRFSFYALANGAFRAIELTNFDVAIYNDISEEGFQSVFPSTESEPMAIADNRTLVIDVESTIINPRDEVKVVLKVTDEHGQSVPARVSMSVVDASLLGEASDPSLTVCPRPITIDRGINLGFDERIFVQGKIMNDKSEPARVNIIGAYNAKENKMYYSRSNLSGDFTLLLPDQKGDHTLQVVGYLYDEYPDTKVEKKMVTSSASSANFTNVYDDIVQNYMLSSNKRKRIYQHFNQLENDLDIEEFSYDRNDVKPNKTFYVKEYVNFENVGRFFGEILGGQLEFKKDGDVITARTYNAESNRSKGRKNFDYLARSPVFIIDGKMTKNANYVYNMKLGNIERIDLYFDWRDITKQFGTFGEFGYVIITTNLADVELPEADREDIFSYSGIQPDINYPVAIKTQDSNYPLFKPTVYWHPMIDQKKPVDRTVTFNASDDVSSYLITAVARTDDGQIVTGTARFETVSNTN